MKQGPVVSAMTQERQCCNRCRAPLPEGRVQRRCYDCDKEQRAKWKAQTAKHCSQCRAPLPSEAAARWCSECRLVNRQMERAAQLRRPGRACFGCGQTMPVTRWQNYCTDCARRRRQELADTARRKAEGRPARHCGMCRTFLPSGYTNQYCRDCKTVYNRFYWRRLEKQR